MSLLPEEHNMDSPTTNPNEDIEFAELASESMVRTNETTTSNASSTKNNNDGNNHDAILLDIELNDPLKDDLSINNNNTTADNSDDDENYSDKLFQFKKRVKNKRKSTFCCIFSCGSLILTIILLLAPLSTQMIDDWRLFNNSIRTQCNISSSSNVHNNTNITTNNTNNNMCNFEYQTMDGHQLSETCGNKMHETAPCNTNTNSNKNNNIHNDCVFFNTETCNGTMIATQELQRNSSMFVVLLGIGSVFGVITILSGIYSMVLIRSSGIYCSIMAIQNDEDNVCELVQKDRDNKYKKRKRKRRKSKKKTRKHKRHKEHKQQNYKHAKRYKKHKIRKEISQSFDSILSSQFGSSTINSLHSQINNSQIEATINSTMISID